MKFILALLALSWLGVAYYANTHYVSDVVWLAILPTTYLVVLFLFIWE